MAAASVGTLASGAKSLIFTPIKELYKTYNTRHCLSIEARAELMLQLTVEGMIEAATIIVGIPVIRVVGTTNRYMTLAEKFIGKTHKQGLIEIFGNSELSSTEIQSLIKGGRFDSIQNEETRQEIKEIFTDYLAQKYPDSLAEDIIELVDEDSISDEILTALREVEILDADGNSTNYINQIIERKRKNTDDDNQTDHNVNERSDPFQGERNKISIEEKDGTTHYYIYDSIEKTGSPQSSFTLSEINKAIETLTKRGRIRFRTLEQAVEKFAIGPGRQEGSHIIFTVPFQKRPINIQPEGNEAKLAQVRDARKALEMMRNELSKMEPTSG